MNKTGVILTFTNSDRIKRQAPSLILNREYLSTLPIDVDQIANLIIFSPDPVIWMINWQPAGRLGEAWNKLTAVDVICYSRGKLWAPSDKFNTQGLFWQAKELDPTTQPVQGVKLRTTIKIPQQVILEVVADHLTNIFFFFADSSQSSSSPPPDSLLKSWARNIEFLHARRRQILGPRREQSGEMRWEPLWQGCPQPSHRQFMPPMTSMVTHPTSRAPPISYMLDFLSVWSVSAFLLQFIDPGCTNP